MVQLVDHSLMTEFFHAATQMHRSVMTSVHQLGILRNRVHVVKNETIVVSQLLGLQEPDIEEHGSVEIISICRHEIDNHFLSSKANFSIPSYSHYI